MKRMQRVLHLGAVLVTLALVTAGCSRLGLGARTDAQISSDVQNKINSDASIPDKQITISSDNGVVTLSGNVSSEAVRNTASNDAAQIAGVKTVVNNLTVAPTSAASMPAPEQEKPDASVPAPRQRSRARSAPQRSSGGGPNQDSYSGSGSSASAQNSSPSPSAPPPPAAPQRVTIPAGTQFSIRINDQLSSETAQVGDVFHGSVNAPISVGDQTVVPTTADIEGRVVDVKPAARFAGQSTLVLELTKLVMDGKAYSLQTDRWEKSGNARGKSTAAKVGGGAAVGAVLGGIFGGGKGAAIGAAAGAGAGTGVAAANKGQQIVLKPESVLNFQLQSGITVTPGAASSRRPMNQ